MHCALRRAMHAGRRALSTTPAPQSQSRGWVLGVASAAAGAAGALAVAGERPPPSVAGWAARDDPGSSNAEQRFAQWKRVDEQLVARRPLRDGRRRPLACDRERAGRAGCSGGYTQHPASRLRGRRRGAEGATAGPTQSVPNVATQATSEPSGFDQRRWCLRASVCAPSAS